MNWTATIGGLTLAAARQLADTLEEQSSAQAISMAETGEARGLWSVIAYFETEAQAAAIRTASGRVSIAAIPETGWVRRSLEGLTPVSAGRFFLHGSHDRARRRVGGISLEIDAATAFGTGHHGTTWGCLMALDDLLKRRTPRRILDLGSGTGVLGLAAARATLGTVLASDIDPGAVATSRLNAIRNGAGPLLRCIRATGLRHPALAAGAPYDLILANILARPLVDVATGLARALAPGGTLILSGLTRNQERWIAATYRNRGLIRGRSIPSGNWSTLTFVKQKRPELEGSGR